MATAEMLELMTAEEFGRRPDPGYPEELVRGRVVAMSVPDRRHGYVCGRAVLIFGNFVEARDIGRVMCNDSGVITERGPRYCARCWSRLLQLRPAAQRYITDRIHARSARAHRRSLLRAR